MDDAEVQRKDDENEPGNKTGQVYIRLKSLIVNQKLPPRTPLEMGLIANKLGVSKTPVREALIILAHEEIIKKDGMRSYYTRPLNTREVAADYEAAFMIIKFNIERFGHKLNLRGLSLLSLTGISRGDDENAPYAEASAIEELYLRIANISGNPRLFRQMREFNDRNTFIRTHDLRDEQRAETIMRGMALFTNFLEREDFDGAIECLETQLAKKLDILPKLVREGNAIATEAINIFTDGMLD